jgi:uncharacterized protein (DUF427 family)
MFALNEIYRQNERASEKQIARKANSLEAKEAKGIAKKRDYFGAFEGSERLFNACWNAYRKAVREGNAIEDVSAFLDAMASDKVNDSKSVFYLYG